MPAPLDIPALNKNPSLAEQLVPQLLNLIYSGNLKAGDKLPGQRQLAESLHVARPTLREALRALQLLGVIEIRHGGGVYVAAIQPDTLLGPLHLFVQLDQHGLTTVLEARKIIEGAAIAAAANNINPEQIKQLQDNLSQLQQLSDEPEFCSASFERLAQQFRAVLKQAIGNPLVARSVESLGLLNTAARHQLQTKTSLQPILANHQAMLAALIKRDADSAQRALEQHIDYLLQCNEQD